jgi:hypothetical protein
VEASDIHTASFSDLCDSRSSIVNKGLDIHEIIKGIITSRLFNGCNNKKTKELVIIIVKNIQYGSKT